MKMDQLTQIEMEKDIQICENHSTLVGSEELYNCLVAKYSVIDSNFSKDLSTCGKIGVPGKSFDFRPELKAIAGKLRMMLLHLEPSPISVQNDSLLIKAKELLERGNLIGIEEYHPAEKGFPFSYVEGPKYNKWMGDIKLFTDRHLEKHPLYKDISVAYERRNNPDSYNYMIGYLETLVDDNDFWESRASLNTVNDKDTAMSNSNKVFIVHGHDTAAKESVARFLEKIGFEAIILHEQADMGLTIIEKIEEFTDVSFAVVLYTECDIGRAKEETEKDNHFRARQNVVFEHGYLIGKLKRNHVVALVKGDIETPGDITGVIYTRMDEAGAWKMNLVKNMKAVGLNIDTNKVFQ